VNEVEAAAASLQQKPVGGIIEKTHIMRRNQISSA